MDGWMDAWVGVGEWVVDVNRIKCGGQRWGEILDKDEER